MLQAGSRVAIVGCSDGRPAGELPLLERLYALLRDLGLEPALSPCLHAGGGTASPRLRARALEAAFADSSIGAVFDISGGDAANGILSCLDFDLLAAHPKPFFGYSDLTCVLNALWTRCGLETGLYQIKNLLLDPTGGQLQRFRDTLLGSGSSLYEIQWSFLQGAFMEGVVLGGNLRCLLKLAGTPWFPDLRGKLLFLESYSGGAGRMEACLTQLQQMGIFQSAAGLLLGTFTQLDREEGPGAVEALARRAAGPALPMARTDQVGHGASSRCLRLGVHLSVGAPSEL